MIKLRLAEAAKSDIRAISAFSKSTFGARITRDYLNGLDELFGLLRQRPLIGTPQGDLGDGLRRVPFRSHRVYYRVTPAIVTIVRVLHHAQDEHRQFGSS